MAQDIQYLVGELVVDIARQKAQSTEDIAADVRDRAGKQVGVSIGPRGGETVIRSKRGEPPRRETGRLQNSIQAETVNGANYVISEVSSDVSYAAHLQLSLDRPITEDVADATLDLVLDRIVDAIENP